MNCFAEPAHHRLHPATLEVEDMRMRMRIWGGVWGGGRDAVETRRASNVNTIWQTYLGINRNHQTVR